MPKRKRGLRGAAQAGAEGGSVEQEPSSGNDNDNNETEGGEQGNDEEASTSGSNDDNMESIDMSELPEPEQEEGPRRLNPQYLKHAQIRRVLQEIGDAARTQELILDPLLLSVKTWKKADTRLLERAIQACGQKLVALNLNPSACNVCLPTSVGDVILQHCPNLEVLCLHDTPLTPNTLGALGTLVRLHALQLGGIALCHRDPLDTSVLGPALARCTELKALDITDTEITDDTLQQMVSQENGGGVRQLVQLDLNSSSLLTDDGVVAVAEANPNLSELSLLNCEQVGVAGVQALGESCPLLEELDLQRARCTTAMTVLCRGCPQLHRLNLSCCALTDVDLEAIAGLGNLRVLDLNAASGFGAKALERSLKQMKTLENLSLNGQRSMQKLLDQVLTKALGSRRETEQGPSDLQHLDLNNSSATAKGVQAVQERHPACVITTIHCDL